MTCCWCCRRGTLALRAVLERTAYVCGENIRIRAQALDAVIASAKYKSIDSYDVAIGEGECSVLIVDQLTSPGH
ncbi:hypothetical protein KIN20_032920 [Parelaphostrongylus tenuis]|uniref:Uncharacterized protein n=1 Tax=Parelaphostrongylus tenuis TaxID=148309 RepID=A0AAD5R7A3_PARTN|nr:hypothetical protein KIN20_032920 [Parelaphostrongylus tenuis]